MRPDERLALRLVTLGWYLPTPNVLSSATRAVRLYRGFSCVAQCWGDRVVTA
jgi:hypothetical protein